MKNYTDNTILPMRFDLEKCGYIVKDFTPETTRGTGVDCLLPSAIEYDEQEMDKQRSQIYCNIYNPESPYMFEFTPLAAQYPYDHEYKWVDSEDNPDANYLDTFPSYGSLDAPTKTFFDKYILDESRGTVYENED